ncbi:hypothetical protein LUX57_44815 [Actinomadura madurae]|nr:hypothetical protein [Actinomadura madurae]MCP9971367.1 hypothetical protein [Actinomadura madurae]
MPLFRSVTAKVTVSPARGLPGFQVTACATRSELGTGATVSCAPATLSVSFSSISSSPASASAATA